jgi:hypothetical protein
MTDKKTVIDVIKVLIRDNDIVASDLFTPEYVPIKYGGECIVVFPNVKPFKDHYLGVLSRPQVIKNPTNTLLPEIAHMQIVDSEPIFSDNKYFICRKNTK